MPLPAAAAGKRLRARDVDCAYVAALVPRGVQIGQGAMRFRAIEPEPQVGVAFAC